MSKETIGPKIKRFRQKRKLTQDELAASLGYSGKSVISHIEKGDADMTYEKILLLLRTYMLDANELFDIREIDKRIDDWRMERRKGKKVAIYIHGMHGSAKEADDYSYLSEEYDVLGLDYQDGNPWELEQTIRSEFEKLTKNYKEVMVIANSIGAFYAYEYLSECPFKHAFFISPIASMHQIIFNIMMREGIGVKDLEEKRFISCKDGTMLSFDFYRHVSNDKDAWEVPTDVLYGSGDELVYIENIADFLADHPKAKLTVKHGAGHYFHTPKEREFIKEWILASLGPRD
ncbi:MAG: helix-turn-helix domain-containing protein [Bacilli bacterium]|nr:helix-turn-helix domain-containing protein [Bacilli bacterium]